MQVSYHVDRYLTFVSEIRRIENAKISRRYEFRYSMLRLMHRSPPNSNGVMDS